jgi:hypothetical protein
MVRQIALDFLFKPMKTKLFAENDDVALAMAFILAESNRKTKAKLKFLTPLTVPFWIVQISDTNSIALSAFGESSVGIELSEDTATGPVRRILNTEISRFEDIPPAVDKALPLLRTVEPRVYQVRNIQDPELLVTHGSKYAEVDPNDRLNSLELKIDSQTALAISLEFQSVMEGARQRFGTMEQLQKLTREKLTDQLKVMENIISSEMARWDKRLKTQEESSNLRTEKLQSRMSDAVYKLKDKHQKDRRALLAQFARDTVGIEQFFARILDDIRTSREQIATLELEEAIQKYRELVQNLETSVPVYTNVTDSIDDLADASVLSAGDLDAKLEQDIRAEEDSMVTQIRELNDKLVEMQEERNTKEREFASLRKKVVESIESMDGMVEKRVDDLRHELQSVQKMTLENNSIPGLAPLTLIHVKVWAATYTAGTPIVFAPLLIPEDRVELPFKHTPMDESLETYVKKLVNQQMKDSASFNTSFRNACDNGNILKNPETIKSFTKGIGNLWTRQLLKEGVRETLEPLYTMLVGKCPECGAEITSSSKFCPECGKSLK